MYEIFCENCSHFLLKQFQSNSFGEVCFLEQSYRNMQKNHILTILRVPLFDIRENAFNSVSWCRWHGLYQGISIIFPWEPWMKGQREFKDRQDAQEPKSTQFSICFYVFWNWKRAKHEGLVGKWAGFGLWTARHLKIPDLYWSYPRYIWCDRS